MPQHIPTTMKITTHKSHNKHIEHDESILASLSRPIANILLRKCNATDIHTEKLNWTVVMRRE